MVAKVIPPNGKIFFVAPGREIHQEPGYDGLPPEDKKALCFKQIFGTEDEFISRSDKIGDKEITREKKRYSENNFPLILPAGTCVEPITRRQMEDELRAQQKPSLKEKY